MLTVELLALSARKDWKRLSFVVVPNWNTSARVLSKPTAHPHLMAYIHSCCLCL